MSFQFLLTDDATAATALAFGPTAAGATSATQILHAWFNKGTPGGSISNLTLQAVDPATGLDSGLDWLDQTWIEARVNGGANPGAALTFVSLTTDWYRLGDSALLPLPNLPGNCAYYVEIRLHPPLLSGAPTESVNFQLVANYNTSALSLTGGLSDLGQGIVTGVGDRTVTEWVEAPTVLATGTPDAYVHVAKRWWVYQGVSLRTYATDDLLFNQNDGAAAALTTGHEYQALISQPPSAGVADVASVVTKGVLSTTGTSILPALPAGNMLIATVLVAYHASASVILQTNITVFAAGGRGKPSIGTGLTVNICALRAIMPGARIINRSARVVTVTGNASPITSYIWLSATDTFTVVPTSAVPPFAGAVPICKCVANATTVTSVTDLRTFFEPAAKTLTLHFPHQEPRYFGHMRSQRKDFAIANAAYTDCSGPAVEMILMSVTALWKVQPTGSTTADIGVSGTTQRYAAAVSTVAASVSKGLIAGPLYYSSPVIRITPNAVSGTNGVVELTFWYFDLRTSSTDEIDTIGAPFAWNLDRMVASMTGGAGTSTGATTFDVKRLSDFSSLCASGAMPSIAAPASYPTDFATGYPSITVGSPDTFGLMLAAVCDPGTSGYNNYDVQCSLVLYPMVVAS
jgi:hypothetical protein